MGSSTVPKSLTLRGVSDRAFGTATLDGGGVGRVLFVGHTFAIDLGRLTTDTSGAARSAFSIAKPQSATYYGAAASGPSQGNTAEYGGGAANRGTGTLTFSAPATRVGGNHASVLGGGVLFVAGYPESGSITGGCPVPVGNVLYHPADTPGDYAGFGC